MEAHEELMTFETAQVLAEIKALKAECELLARLIIAADEIEAETGPSSVPPGEASRAFLI